MRKNSTPPIAFTSAALLALALSAILIGAQAAQLNSQIPFQGKLTDNNGKPVDGTAKIKIEIYDAASAGNLLWSDTFSTVQVKKGIFSVYLGGGASKLTSDVAKDSPLYAQVFVNDKKLDPRIPVVTGLKVYSAANADSATTAAAFSGTLDASKISGFLADGNIPALAAGKITSGTFDSARIPNLALSKLPIDRGTASISNTNSVEVSFTKSLTSPIVVCSAKANKVICEATSINDPVGKFTLKAYDISNPSATVTSDVYWIAIGS